MMNEKNITKPKKGGVREHGWARQQCKTQGYFLKIHFEHHFSFHRVLSRFYHVFICFSVNSSIKQAKTTYIYIDFLGVNVACKGVNCASSFVKCCSKCYGCPMNLKIHQQR